LIKSLRENGKYAGKRLLKIFPNKNWSLGRLKALVKQEGQHPLTGQRASNFRLLANQ